MVIYGSKQVALEGIKNSYAYDYDSLKGKKRAYMVLINN